MDSTSNENKNTSLNYWNDMIPYKVILKHSGDKKDRFYYKYRTKEYLSNGFRTMHGGSIFTMFNVLCKKSIVFKSKNKEKSDMNSKNNIDLIEQSTKYLNPIQLETDIIIEITLEKDGKDIIFCTGHIYEYSDLFENENNTKSDSVKENDYEKLKNHILKLKILCICNSTYIRKTVKF